MCLIAEGSMVVAWCVMMGCREEAAAHYAQAGNLEKLVECHYMLEDFASLEKTMHALPDKSPLLFTLGEKFMHMGIYENAVTAFLRVGDVKMAVDVCVMLNQVPKATPPTTPPNPTARRVRLRGSNAVRGAGLDVCLWCSGTRRWSWLRSTVSRRLRVSSPSMPRI